MLVPGAIARTSAAWATKSPAEAARAPLGYTYTTTGTLEFRRLVTISSIELEIPPGVLTTTRRASAWSASARLTADWMYDDMMVLMSPLRSASSTRGVEAAALMGSSTAAANLGMVIRLAEAHHDSALSVPDLVMEGSIGLVEAARSFASSGEPDFAKFAARKVGDQMDAAIAAETAAVRDAELLVAAASD